MPVRTDRQPRTERAPTAGRAPTSSQRSRYLGVTCPRSGSACRWRELGDLGQMRRTARRAEELGYASLWTFQRVLYPADGSLYPSHRAVHDPPSRSRTSPGTRTGWGWGRRPSARSGGASIS